MGYLLQKTNKINHKIPFLHGEKKLLPISGNEKMPRMILRLGIKSQGAHLIPEPDRRMSSRKQYKHHDPEPLPTPNH